MPEVRSVTDLLLQAAESRIQGILLKLDGDLVDAGLKVDGLSVDTRNFGNLKCEVLVASRNP